MPSSEQGGGKRERRRSGLLAKPETAGDLKSVDEPNQDEQPEQASGGGRRVEIMLDDELYDRVRIKAMRQRKSLRCLE